MTNEEAMSSFIIIWTKYLLSISLVSTNIDII